MSPSPQHDSRPVIRSSAPGRICLFGEHQDYLGLPVIAMAVDRFFQIEYRPTDSRLFTVHTPDLPDRPPSTLDIEAPAPRGPDDFCWGIARVLLEAGFVFPRGGELTFTSNIPFQAGCSSSSAMSAAWMRLLLEIGEHPERAEFIEDPVRAAYLVYRGEKEKFHGAGGMMDQYACYLGGLLHIYPAGYPGAPPVPAGTPYGVERLPATLGDIILIDSGQPKDTQGVLSSVGDRARAAVSAAVAAQPDFVLREWSVADFDRAAPGLSSEFRQIVRDHLINRDLCRAGLAMFRSRVDDAALGPLLNEEHRVLSRTLGISTPLIDELQAACNAAGARGGKINGSGGGGTLFCYAPGAGAAVSELLQKRGVRHYAVAAAPGARILP